MSEAAPWLEPAARSQVRTDVVRLLLILQAWSVVGSSEVVLGVAGEFCLKKHV